MAMKKRKDESQRKDRPAKKAHVKDKLSKADGLERHEMHPNAKGEERRTPAQFSTEVDEPDFPRGGGSALTPSEVRETQLQAESEFQRDATNQRRVKKGPHRFLASRESAGESLFGHGITGKLPTSVDVLRYKSLNIGMKLWGAVAEVNHRDLVISLPGGLRGFVHMEEVSDSMAEILKEREFKAKGAKKLKRSRGETGSESGLTSQNATLSSGAPVDLSLKDLFVVGQLVGCRVTSLERRSGNDGKGKDNKRVGLSLRLQLLHDGLTLDSFQEGTQTTACVSSVEDHGYLLTFGVPGVSGFLLKQNCEEEKDPKRGQLLQGVVISVDRKRGTVSMKSGKKAAAGSMVQEHVGLTMDTLLPGTSVNARVVTVLKNGLLLSFLTYFTGTVDLYHLDNSLLEPNWKDKYTQNQRLKAKILHVDPSTKAVGLTINSDLLRNTRPIVDVEMGETFDGAVVRRIDPTIGLLLELPSKPAATAGYVHISSASDAHIEKLEKKFSPGKKVRARVIGFRILDGLATVSLKKSVLDQLLVSHADVKPGMIVFAKVTAVEAFGAVVQLGDTLKGLCPLQHMSEYQRSTPSPKFQIGARLKFRVLSCDLKSRKITLTHKKTLVSSKLSLITSYDDAVEGLVTHGWISGIEEYGCFVSFYNDVTGLAHRSELGVPPGTMAQSVFQLGQCVKCRVLRSNSTSQRLSISFVTVSTRSEASEMEREIQPGEIVPGTIAYMREKSLILDVHLSAGVMKGVLVYDHLSDNPGHVEQAKSLLKPGYKFDRLLILEKLSEKLILSAKYSLLAAGNLPSDISQLHSQAIYQGFVASITEQGCFTRFLGRLTGLASLGQVADGFVSDASQLFTVGQSVRAQILGVNEEAGRFHVSLKQSACFSVDASLIKGYFMEEEKLAELSRKSNESAKNAWPEELTIGSYVDGEIQDIKEYGVIMSLHTHDDIVGFLTHYQLAESVEVGRKVRAKVLDVVKADGILDLTLRPELLSQPESFGKGKSSSSKKRTFTDLQQTFDLNATVNAVVELVKDEYLVLSLPDHQNFVAFGSTRDYNLRVVDPHQLYQPGQRLAATIKSLPDPSTGNRLLVLIGNTSDLGQPEQKRARKNFRCYPGALVQGEITSIDSTSIALAVGDHYTGVIHITEVWDDVQEGHPFSPYAVGQTITAKVLEVVRSRKERAGKGCFHLELSVRPSELTGEGITDAKKRSLSFEDIIVGHPVTAYVQDINDESAWLLLGRHLRGSLFVLDSSDLPSELLQFKNRFHVGHAVRSVVAAKNPARGTLDLSIINIPDSFKDFKSKVEPGMVLAGRVTAVLPECGGLSVQIARHQFGRIHITQLSDVWEDNPEKDFKVGQFVRCVVLEVGSSADGKPRIDLSVKPSLGGSGSGETKGDKKLRSEVAAVVETFDDLSVGLVVQGYVKGISKKGCFVNISRALDARILISQLSDSFVADPNESFPVGKLVKGRITSLERLSGRVEMSLKTTENVGEVPKGLQPNQINFEDFHVGDILNGRVRRIEKFGVFISIVNSNIVGMCHVSEISDYYVKDIQSHFSVGQDVRAKILKIDMEKRRISLGLKDSDIKEREETEVMEEMDSPPDGLEDLSDGKSSDISSDNEHSGQQGGDIEDDLVKVLSGGNDENMAEDNDDLHVLLAGRKLGTLSEAVPPLEVNLDLDDDDDDDEAELDDTQPKDGVGAKMDVLDHSNDDLKSKKEIQRTKRRLKKEREEEIKAAEEKRLREDQTPETIEDHEQLVRTSPNSSFVWVKYMAFMLSMADVDKARDIAERALKVIHFREEDEKLNIWVAYLNLENAYGSPKKEAVMKVFQRAMQFCDQKKLQLAVLKIYEQNEQHDMADDLLKTLLRKFKTSAKVWLRSIQNLLKRGLADAAQKKFEQSLLSLPRRKHVKVISQVAIMEFKIGSAERGRSIFEGVVRNYPRRTDLWSIYLDQEIRLKDNQTVIRTLFERAVSLDLPPKKMKFLFKKYLDFEKAHGNDERAEYVKRKAMDYVEAKLG